MRPIDFCTPKPSNSSTRAIADSQRCDPKSTRRSFRPLARGSLSYRALRLVLVHAKRLFSRSSSTSPRTCGADTRQLGPPDANEAGGSRGSQRDPHFSGRAKGTRGRFLPLRATATTASGTPVASSVLVGMGSRCDPTLWLEGRQDRFRGGPVKGVRFPDPRCLPSPDAPHNPPAPKMRTNLRSPESIARRSRDEDRRVSTNRLPFTRSKTLRSRARFMLVAEPPFTRSVWTTRLSTRVSPVARFSGREGVLPTSAIHAMHGHLPREHRFLVCGSER